MQVRSAAGVVEAWLREIYAEPAKARSTDVLSLSQLLAGADDEYILISDLMEEFCESPSLEVVVRAGSLGRKALRAVVKGAGGLIAPQLLAQFGCGLVELLPVTPLRLCAAVLACYFSAAVDSGEPPDCDALERIVDRHPLLGDPFLSAAIKLLAKYELLIRWREEGLAAFLGCVLKVLAAEAERRREFVSDAAHPQRVQSLTPFLELFFALCRPVFLVRVIAGEEAGSLEKAILSCMCVGESASTASPLHFQIVGDCISSSLYLQRLPMLCAKFPFLRIHADHSGLFVRRCAAVGKDKLAEQFLTDVSRASVEVEAETCTTPPPAHTSRSNDSETA